MGKGNPKMKSLGQLSLRKLHTMRCHQRNENTIKHPGTHNLAFWPTTPAAWEEGRGSPPWHPNATCTTTSRSFPKSPPATAPSSPHLLPYAFPLHPPPHASSHGTKTKYLFMNKVCSPPGGTCVGQLSCQVDELGNLPGWPIERRPNDEVVHVDVV